MTGQFLLLRKNDGSIELDKLKKYGWLKLSKLSFGFHCDPGIQVGVVPSFLTIGCFKHGKLDLQLEPQLNPNSNPNLTRVGVQVGVLCLNPFFFMLFRIST